MNGYRVLCAYSIPSANLSESLRSASLNFITSVRFYLSDPSARTCWQTGELTSSSTMASFSVIERFDSYATKAACSKSLEYSICSPRAFIADRIYSSSAKYLSEAAASPCDLDSNERRIKWPLISSLFESPTTALITCKPLRLSSANSWLSGLYSL